MLIGLTGTPGVGKSSIAKELGEFFGCKVINEKEFSVAEGIVEFDKETNEFIVPLDKLEKRLRKFIKNEKNLIVEGHLICETKLPLDFMVVIQCNPEILELRLQARGYSEEKIQDNVFCEGIDYCKKHAKRLYSAEKLIFCQNRKSIKETALSIILEIEKRMRQKNRE
jgi:adenylate kinase